MIPKTIHYCWFGRKPLPPLAARCISTWHKVMPDYEIRRWDEGSIQGIGIPEISELLKKKQWAFASDVARLYALVKEGGIYLDVDMEAIRKPDHLLKYKCFIGRETADRVTNGASGAHKGHPFMVACLDRIRSRYASRKPVEYSPETTTAVLAQAPWPDVHICEPKVFYPYNPYDQERETREFLYADVTDVTVMVHHWQKSWAVPLHTKLRRALSRMRGAV